MEKLTERLIGCLALDSPHDRISFLINKINENIKPPRQATSENVNIRAMYVVNDLVNSHGGQFRREDLAHLAKLIIDSPVLVGHNRSEAPMARTFHAELEEKGDVRWLKGYFYWPKEADSANDDLLQKIDSGILKECSIAFVYTFPECSVCGEDIRKCSHEINIGGDRSGDTHFIYNGITQVLETSLVYKGSVRGTYITDKLSFADFEIVTIISDGKPCVVKIHKELLDEINTLIIPYWEQDKPIIAASSKFKVATAARNGMYYLLIKAARNEQA